MSSVVSYAIHDSVGVITIDNAPVNALSLNVRAGISTALKTAEHDESIAIVIACAAAHLLRVPILPSLENLPSIQPCPNC